MFDMVAPETEQPLGFQEYYEMPAEGEAPSGMPELTDIALETADEDDTL